MDDQVSLSQFLLKWGTLIIAVYGVVQVWLIALWKRASVGTLQIFKTGLLEVGYNNFGPTLAINGTLRAIGKDVFVSEVALVVKRLHDNSTHQFEWTAFRSPQVHITRDVPITLELPSGLNVRLNQPHRYHIFFSDRQTQAALLSPLTAVFKDWQEYFKSKQNEILATSQSENVDPKNLAQYLYDKDFSKNSDAFRRAWDVLSQNNYWIAGQYEMMMIVKSPSPEQQFTDVRRFEITESEFEDLRLNALATLQEGCLGDSTYMFSYVKYE